MGLLNDIDDQINIKMTERQKGKRAAAQKHAEIQDKKNRMGVK